MGWNRDRETPPRRKPTSCRPPAAASTDGYGPTTLRAIATDVGVDAALVSRYFGSKRDLFAIATEFRIDLPDLADANATDVAGMLLPRYFAVWEDDHTFLALLRAAGTSRVAALYPEHLAVRGDQHCCQSPPSSVFRCHDDGNRRSRLGAPSLVLLLACTGQGRERRDSVAS